MQSEQRLRYEKTLAGATHAFEQRDLPQLEKQLAGHERVYRCYVDASLGLEWEMNTARAARDEVPRLEQRVNVLERASVAHVRCFDPMSTARLDDLARAIEQQYRALPNEIRRNVEYSIRKEQRARDSMTISR